MKWLNLQHYCRLMFPEYQINRIRYFTAQVKSVHPALDQGQDVRQQIYFRALQTLAPVVTIHEGFYTTQRKARHVADPLTDYAVPAIPLRMETVLIPEEKGSDVNLATYLLLDAFRNDSDVSIVVSNDSDLFEPIRIVTAELSRPVVILNPQINSSKHLQTLVGVTHRKVTIKALVAAQFPQALTDETGTFTKPSTW